MKTAPSPHIAALAGYIPGEQPQSGGFLKLNTNESPYPPSPNAADAIRAVLDSGRLRLYPDPMATAVRRAVANRHGIDPDMILAGNGSDDLLTILTRTFVSPGDPIVTPTPSYLLYRTLAELQNAQFRLVPFQPDWSLDPASFERNCRDAKLVFLANPNSPSGTALPVDHVAKLAQVLPCPLIVDEAYAEFANDHCVRLIQQFPNVIITRTLSKAYGLAGLRLGYAIAQPEIIHQLIKVKDSYNCDALAIAAGAAALEDDPHLAETCRKIRKTRARLLKAVRNLGYSAPETQANFVWCEGGPPADQVDRILKENRILVRMMRYAGREPGLRISVGTDAEIDQLLGVLSSAVQALNPTATQAT